MWSDLTQRSCPYCGSESVGPIYCVRCGCVIPQAPRTQDYEKDVPVARVRPRGVLVGSKQSDYVGILGKSNDNYVEFDLSGNHWVLVVGDKGSGKSYTLGVITEIASGVDRLSSPLRNAAVVIFDNRGDFLKLSEINDQTADTEILSKEYGFSPNAVKHVRVSLVAPKPLVSKLNLTQQGYLDISVRPIDLTSEDWRVAFRIGESERPIYFTKFRAIVNRLREIKPDFSVHDLIQEVERQVSRGNLREVYSQAIQDRLFDLEESGIFDADALELGGFLSPSTITVIDTRTCEPWIREILCTMTLRRLVEQIQTSIVKGAGSSTTTLWVVLDEAHYLLPRMRQTPFARIFNEIARVGRHWSVSGLLATQVPDDVSELLVELCDIFVIHKLKSAKLIRSISDKIGIQLRQSEIASLQTGEAIVVDSSTQRSLKVKIRPRITKHPSGH